MGKRWKNKWEKLFGPPLKKSVKSYRGTGLAPPPDKPARENGEVLVYGYFRVSTLDQVKKGFSLQTQETLIRRYFNAHQERTSENMRWGGFLSDKGISALTTSFLKRPGGKRLHQLLQPGDHVIFVRMDRAFRTLLDFAQTNKRWSHDDIVMHFCDQCADMGTASGRFICNILACAAQLDSEMKSERIREVNAVKRSMGVTVGKTNLGYKRVNGMIMPNNKVRAVMLRIATLRDINKISFVEIADKITEDYYTRNGKPGQTYHQYRFNDSDWTRQKVRHWYLSWHKIQERESLVRRLEEDLSIPSKEEDNDRDA